MSKRYEWAIDHYMQDADVVTFLQEELGYALKLEEDGQPLYEKVVSSDREISLKILPGRVLVYCYWLTGGASETYFEYLMCAGFEAGQIAAYLGALEYDGPRVKLAPLKRTRSLT